MPRPIKTFRKKERLSRQKTIQELFTDSSSFYIHPFKVLFKEQNDEPLTQILISVPKKIIPGAAARNTIKRRIREAYRLNKTELSATSSLKFYIAYIYLAKEALDYKTIENKLIESLRRLRKKGAEGPIHEKKN